MNVATLFMRLGLGYIFLMAGARKFYNPAPLRLVAEKLEVIPIDVATFIFILGVVQSMVGLALIIGFYTRFAAVIATIVLFFFVVFLFREKDLALLGTSIALAITGSRFLSVDKGRS